MHEGGWIRMGVFISRVTPDAIIYTYLLLASTFFIQTPFLSFFFFFFSDE